LAGQGRVSLGSQIRGAEEGDDIEAGRGGLNNPTIKMDRKRWFSGHTSVTSKGKPRS